MDSLWNAYVTWQKHTVNSLVGLSLFYVSRDKKTKQILFVRGKFSFLYVGTWFDVTKCKFNAKNSGFEMLVVFLPFLADTKITFVYNFVALKKVFLYFFFKSRITSEMSIYLNTFSWKTLCKTKGIFRAFAMSWMELCETLVNGLSILD